VAESQKLRRLTIHALRHSFASILLMGRTPDAEVSAQLGHADVYTTKKIYSHFIPKMGYGCSGATRKSAVEIKTGAQSGLGCRLLVDLAGKCW
jgi:hypothetical protein